LTAYLTSRPIIVTIVIQNDLVVLGETRDPKDFLEGEMLIIVFEVLDFGLKVEGFFEEDFECG
jgi:hypothetical protein